MQQYYQYLTILLTLSVFLTLYFNYANESVSSLQANEYTTNNSQLKTVVAYSFLKQIENDNVEVDCDNDQTFDGRGQVSQMKEASNGQWTNVGNTSVFVYSAYPDYRVRSFVYIRFIAMVKDHWNGHLYCQFHSPQFMKVIRATKTNIWSKNWKNPDPMMPVLFSCPINKIYPFYAVTLSSIPCQLSDTKYKFNQNNVNKTHSDDATITICVKPLNFGASDIVHRLITWIEMNSLLGVRYFDIYFTSVSKKALKLLKWFHDVRKNVMLKHYVSLTNDSDINNVTPIWRKRKNELITYNDCFYRNLHKTNFVIPLDIDEIIVPKLYTTFQELLSNLTLTNKQVFDKYASLSVKNAFFFHKSDTHNIFDSVFRTKYSAPYRSGKSFINTANTMTVFNHYSLKSLFPGVSKTYFLNETLAQLNHYRRGCDINLLPEDCNRILNSSPVFDDSLLRFKTAFLKRYIDVNNKFGNVL